MKLMRALLLVLAAALLTPVAAPAQEPEMRRELLDLTLQYRYDKWIMAPDAAPEPWSKDSRGTRAVVLSVVRAIDPRTGQPYDTSEPILDFDPKDLRFLFRLEKQEFLLGEPILVEHRIELNGPGKWGWYIAFRRGSRDENYTLVLRRADGKIVPTVYPRLEDSGSRVQIGTEHKIEKGKPFSYWLALQRYAAITEPGVYDLYCLANNYRRVMGEVAALRAALPEAVARDHFINSDGELIDRTTVAPSRRYSLRVLVKYLNTRAGWPMAGLVPPDVLAFASGKGSADRPSNNDWSYGIVAHFRIRIRQGSASEQREMVERWTKDAGAITLRSGAGSRDSALLQALWYAKQDYYWPQLENWITSEKETNSLDARPLYLDTLAMRPDKAAFALLLKGPPLATLSAFYNLHPDRIAEAIPLCIEWLTHADNHVRALAENRLIGWTGQSFERTWKGYDYRRPTLAEGQSMQPRWREWWEKNKRTFKPRQPCPVPCEKTEKKKDEAR